MSERPFDGVICFGGEDWWYHNRAHYDMQMMREISAEMPVLYINSIGMRVPTPGEGGMFFKRVARKLASFRRGLVRVRERFAVQSPIVVPGRRGMAISSWLLPRQVRRAARKLGIERPLVWVACPPGARFLDDLNPVKIVYQRTDRFETYEGVDSELIAGYDQTLKERADVVLYCSRHLFDTEREAVGDSATLIDHGVDFGDFVAAGDGQVAFQAVPAIANLPRPRAGFVGDLDEAVFDSEFLLAVARELPDVSFVLVGSCSLAEGWASAVPNVHLTGRVPYEDVPHTMAAMDVLLMPWHRSEWIEACNPIKLKEYLATGRPIVSTDFPELRHYEGLVAIADEPAAFAALIRAALEACGTREQEELLARGRVRVADATWTSRARAALDRVSASDSARTGASQGSTTKATGPIVSGPFAPFA